MKRVAWIGRYLGNNGFATATRRYVLSLKSLYNNVIIAPLEDLPSTHEFFSLIQPIQDDDFTILNHLPTTDPTMDAYFSVWEYDQIPESWIDILENAKLIFTQSSYCRDIFKKSLNNQVNIHLIPYILGESYLNYTSNGPRLSIAKPHEFVFGSVFEWVARKCPERMIEAFLTEFKPNEPVKLVLRTRLPIESQMTSAFKMILPQFKNAIKSDRILIIDEEIVDLTIFYRSINSFILCSAGEGWGQPLSEAMACGLPTIGSRHGGNLDFMNDSNSYLVDVEEWSPVIDPSPLTFANARWKLPQIQSIQKTMRRVYEMGKSKNSDPRGINAIKIRNTLTPSKIGSLIYHAIHPFL